MAGDRTVSSRLLTTRASFSSRRGWRHLAPGHEVQLRPVVGTTHLALSLFADLPTGNKDTRHWPRKARAFGAACTIRQVSFSSASS